ncbi:MAG: hypothetical protein M1814_000533 [Vezdaea aestivalis]|nr:MAG: hypothetical protein M1814_000533 [Vezdaea aestivalis]
MTFQALDVILKDKLFVVFEVDDQVAGLCSLRLRVDLHAVQDDGLISFPSGLLTDFFIGPIISMTGLTDGSKVQVYKHIPESARSLSSWTLGKDLMTLIVRIDDPPFSAIVAMSLQRSAKKKSPEITDLISLNGQRHSQFNLLWREVKSAFSTMLQKLFPWYTLL